MENADTSGQIDGTLTMENGERKLDATNNSGVSRNPARSTQRKGRVGDVGPKRYEPKDRQDARHDFVTGPGASPASCRFRSSPPSPPRSPAAPPGAPHDASASTRS
jgi:hypothetical protein